MSQEANESPQTGAALPGWWHRRNFRQEAIDAFKAGLAATLCLLLGHLFGLVHSYWAAISAIVVMGSNSAVTLTSCRDRLIGTAIGAFLGWATSTPGTGMYWFTGWRWVPAYFFAAHLSSRRPDASPLSHSPLSSWCSLMLDRHRQPSRASSRWRSASWWRSASRCSSSRHHAPLTPPSTPQRRRYARETERASP